MLTLDWLTYVAHVNYLTSMLKQVKIATTRVPARSSLDALIRTLLFWTLALLFELCLLANLAADIKLVRFLLIFKKPFFLLSFFIFFKFSLRRQLPLTEPLFHNFISGGEIPCYVTAPNEVTFRQCLTTDIVEGNCALGHYATRRICPCSDI